MRTFIMQIRVYPKPVKIIIQVEIPTYDRQHRKPPLRLSRLILRGFRTCDRFFIIGDIRLLGKNKQMPLNSFSTIKSEINKKEKEREEQKIHIGKKTGFRTGHEPGSC